MCCAECGVEVRKHAYFSPCWCDDGAACFCVRTNLQELSSSIVHNCGKFCSYEIASAQLAGLGRFYRRSLPAATSVLNYPAELYESLRVSLHYSAKDCDMHYIDEGKREIVKHSCVFTKSFRSSNLCSVHYGSKLDGKVGYAPAHLLQPCVMVNTRHIGSEHPHHPSNSHHNLHSREQKQKQNGSVLKCR